jgi:hypothetical protein
MRRSRPVALAVFWAGVPRPINVVVAQIPGAAWFDRLPAAGALDHPGLDIGAHLSRNALCANP